MSDAESEAVKLLLSKLGGQLVKPGQFQGWEPCPVCGRLAPPSIYGRSALCRSCTETEVGEYADEMVLRVGRRMTLTAFRKLPRDSDGRPIMPSLPWKAWRKLWI